MRKNKILSMILLIISFCIMNIFTPIGSAAAALPAADADKEIVLNAYQKLAKVKSCHITFDSTISLVFNGKNMNISAKGESDIQTKPMIVKNVMTVASSVDWRKTEHTIVQYIEKDGDQLVAYSNENNQWIKTVSPYNQPDTNDKYDYGKMIAKVMPKGETADAALYEVTISGTYLRQALTQMTTADASQKTKLPEDLLQEIGDFKYLVTIDKKSAAVSKFQIDLSEFLAPIGSRIISSSKLSEEQKKDANEVLSTMKAVLSLTFSRINAVKPMVIPPEVRNTAVNIPITPNPANNIPTGPSMTKQDTL